MAATTVIHVRGDEHIKNRATETLASMGLTVPDAVRVLFTRLVAEKRAPSGKRALRIDVLARHSEAERSRLSLCLKCA